MIRYARSSLVAAVALGALIGATAIALTPLAQPSAEAAVGECPPGSLPGPGNSNPIWTDNNVSMYAGEDFTALPSSAEVEGLLVVGGDAEFAGSNGTFNVGWVGVGSGVAPTPGSVMLAVGGGITVGAGTVLDVGANAFDNGVLLGGSVQVGGATAPDYEVDGSRYRLNNGALTQDMGADAIAPWATWGADIASESAGFALLPDTGTTVAEFGRITFTGTTGVTQQVFSVTGAQLAAFPEIAFVGIEDGQSVIINVTGSAPVTWAPNYFGDDGERADDFASSRFGPVSSRTLWNFPSATSLHVAGSSQVLGSILVPAADPDALTPAVRVTASTNGRLYTNGSVVMDGVGNEHHNYPWIEAPFDCIPGEIPVLSGSVTITKVVSPEDGQLLPPDALFRGIVVCDNPVQSMTIAEWAVRAGETTTVDELPVGATCTVSEQIGVGARAFALPVGQTRDSIADFTWETPVWSPEPPTFVVTGGVEPQIAFTVTNAIAYGSFTIEKTVTGPDAPSRTFMGTWACRLTPETGADGTWSLEADQVSEEFQAPIGSLCAVAENAPPTEPGGTWQVPVITPESFRLAAGQEPVQVAVENAFVADDAPIGAFQVRKVVDNAAGVAFDGGFAGSYACSVDGVDDALMGAWSVDGAGLSDPITAPVGAVCSVTETDPPDPVDGVWALPEVAPGSITITAESAQSPIEITVTNTLMANGAHNGGGGEGTGSGTGAGGLPATGGTIPLAALGFGLAAVAVGAMLLVLRRRRA